MSEQMTINQYLHPIPRLKDKYMDEEWWYDDWHYVDNELPPENDIYYTIREFKDCHIYGYQAFCNDTWYVYDSYFHKWERVRRSDDIPFAWVRIPSLYNRVDKHLHEMQGMNGII